MAPVSGLPGPGTAARLVRLLEGQAALRGRQLPQGPSATRAAPALAAAAASQTLSLAPGPRPGPARRPIAPAAAAPVAAPGWTPWSSPLLWG